MPEVDWVAAGLLDPNSENAPQRRELLAWLEARGCSVDDLVEAAAAGNLHSAAADRALMPPPTLTREEAAERTGLTVEQIDRTWLAAGFPPPAPGAKVFAEDDLLLLGVAPLVSSLFGEDAMLGFLRVCAASLARIAEAADAMFLSDVEAPRRAAGAAPVELAEAVDQGVHLLLGLPNVIAPLFRRHAAAAILRSRVARADNRGAPFAGPYRVPLVVGFADLVGFTTLAARTDARALATLVARFERGASDRAVAAGARVVKAMGDAVMVVGREPAAVVDVLLGIIDDVGAEPELDGVRAAVVAGDVVVRDGDYLGPTVNLAARATKEAPPGGLVVNEPVADALAAAGRPTRPLEPRQLRGIDDLVVLWEVGGE